jgi:hypothetical protein
MKVGYQGTYMTDDRTWFTNSQNLAYRVDNGVPNQLTELISPWVNNARAAWEAVFAQEQWTRGRLTLQGALRYDHAGSWFPAQQEGPSRFLPVAMVFPETKGVDSYNDITPRFGAAYDVFGNGRTAIRANVGKYLEGVGVQLNYANSNPTLRVPTSTGPFQTQGVTRTWTDNNHDFVPNCDLLNPQANSTGGDFCGQMSNTAFGQPVLTNNYDPALLHGWGVRASDWNLGVSVQQQIAARASVEVAYSRRWYHGFTVTDNTIVTAADYSPYSVTAPADPRLPGGGGYQIAGLYDVSPSKSGQISNLITDSQGYGNEYQYFNGVDLTLNVRMRNGVTIQGGTSTGKTVADACDVRANLPELNVAIGAGLGTSTVSPTSPYCHADYGWLTQFRGLATYVVPKIDVQISGVMQSKPGAMLAANFAVPAATVAQTLGRLPSGNVTNVTVNLVAPGQMYGDRINQLDLRAAKILRFGKTRTMIGVDMYNALNSSAILTYNNTYGGPAGTWLLPNSILTGRMTRISAEFSW